MKQSSGLGCVEETSRRDFLRSSAAIPAAALAALPIGASAYAAGSDTIRIGMIGCGPRNTDAADEQMQSDKGVQLVAMADILMARVQRQRKLLKDKYPGQVAVDDDHCFAGFDAYMHVIESADLVLIANAAKFHPLHLMAAIQAGKHVFVEKPHAIDPAGVKVVQAACDLARQKNLCVLSGLHSRFHPGWKETMQRVYDGAIGEIQAFELNFLREPYNLYQPTPGLSEVEQQATNQMHFHWLSGDDMVQSMVHNLDQASWAMHNRQMPVKCHGMGGRCALREPIYGNVFDHHAVVYEFASGIRIYALCRTVPGCYNSYSSYLLGSKGRCDLMEMRITGQTNWKHPENPNSFVGPGRGPHTIEQAELLKAIRSGNPMNCGDYMAHSTLMGIMGQISCYTGKEVTWDQASASDFYYAPRPEEVSAGMEPPVKPNADGTYPAVAIPGVTKML
jgi:myo-inositol 2-dehydrogenase / D-chiro-inositol 1-dehydrogenase